MCEAVRRGCQVGDWLDGRWGGSWAPRRRVGGPARLLGLAVCRRGVRNVPTWQWGGDWGCRAAGAPPRAASPTPAHTRSTVSIWSTGDSHQPTLGMFAVRSTRGRHAHGCRSASGGTGGPGQQGSRAAARSPLCRRPGQPTPGRCAPGAAPRRRPAWACAPTGTSPGTCHLREAGGVDAGRASLLSGRGGIVVDTRGQMPRSRRMRAMRRCLQLEFARGRPPRRQSDWRV